MLYFDDAKNLRAALKMFALEFFGTEADKADGRRILSGSFTDCRIYPAMMLSEGEMFQALRQLRRCGGLRNGETVRLLCEVYLMHSRVGRRLYPLYRKIRYGQP